MRGDAEEPSPQLFPLVRGLCGDAEIKHPLQPGYKAARPAQPPRKSLSVNRSRPLAAPNPRNHLGISANNRKTGPEQGQHGAGILIGDLGTISATRQLSAEILTGCRDRP